MEKLEELKSLQASLANELSAIHEDANRLSLRAASVLECAEDILRQICLMDTHADADILMAKFNERKEESPNA